MAKRSKKKVKVKYEKCVWCDGTGRDEGDTYRGSGKCAVCKGTGKTVKK